MTAPTRIVAILTARPGKADALRELLDSMLAEPGNLRYDLWADEAEPGRFLLDELYADAAAVAAHRASSHFEAYLTTINDLAERNALMLRPLSVA